MIPKIELLNIDCMEYMATLPDKAFDLAIVDPPYGLGDVLTKGGINGGWAQMINGKSDKWDIIPKKEYFKELFRVSINQIIWGGNYFDLPPCKQPICWDKIRPNQKNVSEWEYAWTSFSGRSRLFSYCNNGGFIVSPENYKIHPTQKPIKLYRWLLYNWAKEGSKILDTHLGSASSAIAALRDGRVNFVGTEIDKDYYNAACKRYKEQTLQMPLF